ncbi:MAG: glycosyl hydrolase 53 family protein [Acidobacteria bacterium]|nr:glycosyl hydrolase 53 family protein [Acidobacteriota bacterium]
MLPRLFQVRYMVRCIYYLLLAGLIYLPTSALEIRVAEAADYAIGADLSFLMFAEEHGTVFKENGRAKPGLQIFRDHGYNWIRLRLFHTPSAHRDNMPNDLNYTTRLAVKAKEMGYKFLLCYHYSDSWADPGKQWAPTAWKGKSHAETVMLLQEYTKETMTALRLAGAMPDMVQIGNEITPGMVWPDGRLGDTGPDNNWPNFTDLIKAGIRGVEESLEGASRPRIMIHIDRGGDLPTTRYFFNKIREYGVEYDVIGQSYYPWWHGSLLDLKENLDFMSREYGREIILVEVAYHWKENGEYGDSPTPFPQTPEGQKEFLEALNRLVLTTPNGLGKGIFWWEPAVPLRPGISSRGIFDMEANVLPVIGVFDKYTRGRAGRVTGPGGLTQ